MFESRQYQTEAVTAWKDSIDAGYNSVIAVPTGAGKTVILCSLLQQWMDDNPGKKALVLSHTQEILKQDYEALLEFFPKFGVGIYSAGLQQRDIRLITVAGIHSVYKKPDLFGDTALCVVDEVHSINHESNGMYRSFIKEVGCQVTGMSATVYRMGHGYIYKGKGAIFDSLAYDLTSVRNFNKLVRDGYLTKLISRSTDMEMDSTGISKSIGDYNLKELAETHDVYETTNKAVLETIKLGENYKKWLVFAINTDHASHIAAAFNDEGILAEELHTKMKGNREEVIDRFKYGKTRALVSVGMVTTGFDAPNVDLIVLLRPTLSTVLHVQMIGRGLRVSPGKDHCLVLDFAGNTMRLGPINNPVIPTKKHRKGGAAPSKTCPICKTIMHTMARFCEYCGHEFKFQNKLVAVAGDGDIVQEDGPIWKNVDSVSYGIHRKLGSPSSLKVTYAFGLTSVSEWVCLDHTGYAKYKAENWVKYRDPKCRVFTTEHVFSRTEFLSKPSEIRIDRSGKYTKIVESRF